MPREEHLTSKRYANKHVFLKDLQCATAVFLEYVCVYCGEGYRIDYCHEQNTLPLSSLQYNGDQCGLAASFVLEILPWTTRKPPQALLPPPPQTTCLCHSFLQEQGTSHQPVISTACFPQTVSSLCAWLVEPKPQACVLAAREAGHFCSTLGRLDSQCGDFPQTQEVDSKANGPCESGRCHYSIPANFLLPSIWRSDMWARKDQRKLLSRSSVADVVGVPPISIGIYHIKVLCCFQLPASESLRPGWECWGN